MALETNVRQPIGKICRFRVRKLPNRANAPHGFEETFLRTIPQTRKQTRGKRPFQLNKSSLLKDEPRKLFPRHETCLMKIQSFPFYHVHAA